MSRDEVCGREDFPLCRESEARKHWCATLAVLPPAASSQYEIAHGFYEGTPLLEPATLQPLSCVHLRTWYLG